MYGNLTDIYRQRYSGAIDELVMNRYCILYIYGNKNAIKQFQDITKISEGNACMIVFIQPSIKLGSIMSCIQTCITKFPILVLTVYFSSLKKIMNVSATLELCGTQQKLVIHGSLLKWRGIISRMPRSSNMGMASSMFVLILYVKK